ncbi:hypothetical protein GGI25_005923 [Coemansia spiralis]|uniref:Uncharacterized protein n=2 Tax=Coemansia TaxID=4863 RepID=A0A9W8KVP0_9FUNG|nr:hypothetical protein EDC05_005940 [Coemansia umbellata]KAJ2619171.1 hypothetical protein GGI26_006045 [Coemansia sp. RSA 1358]KAJ2670203.1 hypothetical protein GGI25_005923 [Coemansia spiralis]
MFINTLLFGYAVWYREYPPLKAKNMPLIAMLYLCMLIWYLGTIGTNYNTPGHFNFSSSCILFATWFRVYLGVFLFLHLHIFRIYTYIRIFKRLRRVTVKVYVYGAAIYLVIILGYGVPLTVLRSTLSVQYLPELGTCYYGTTFAELTFAIIWAGWFSIVAITFIARDINTSFNEYHEMVLITTIGSITLTYQTISQNISRGYTLRVWSRAIGTFSEYLVSQTSLFILLCVPVYNCMFHREEYKRRFFEKMRADGMVARYNYSVAMSTGVDTSTAAAPTQAPRNEPTSNFTTDAPGNSESSSSDEIV